MEDSTSRTWEAGTQTFQCRIGTHTFLWGAFANWELNDGRHPSISIAWFSSWEDKDLQSCCPTSISWLFRMVAALSFSKTKKKSKHKGPKAASKCVERRLTTNKKLGALHQVTQCRFKKYVKPTTEILNPNHTTELLRAAKLLKDLTIGVSRSAPVTTTGLHLGQGHPFPTMEIPMSRMDVQWHDGNPKKWIEIRTGVRRSPISQTENHYWHWIHSQQWESVPPNGVPFENLWEWKIHSCSWNNYLNKWGPIQDSGKPMWGSGSTPRLGVCFSDAATSS